MPISTGEPKVVVTKNGPYLVSGGIPLSRQTVVTDSMGDPEIWREDETFPTQESYALCRCGHSSHKPFCDGTHKKVGFDGTEKASREPYRAQATKHEGPSHTLADAAALCAGTDFCQANGTVWKQVARTDDAAVRANFLRQVAQCPSGRLVALARVSGAPIEPALPKSIGLIEEPSEGVSGPLWVRGGIPLIAADGFAYEVRNRMTLCRCGASANKPFCDGSHFKIGFRDQIGAPPP
jgi:CDGSH-type Zn-finger protein